MFINYLYFLLIIIRINYFNVVSLHEKDDLIFDRNGEPFNQTLTKTWLLPIYRANPKLNVFQLMDSDILMHHYYSKLVQNLRMSKSD